MKITKPSVEIIDMKDYDSMIKKIEKIGRIKVKIISKRVPQSVLSPVS